MDVIPKLGLAFATLLVGFIIQRLILHPLRSVPGPFLAKLTDLWYVSRIKNGQFHWDNIALHQKYGSVVRYGPSRVSISDPAAIKKVYSLGTEFNKSTWYNAWTAPTITSMFTERNNKVHAKIRRKFQAMYSMTSMVTYEALTDECTSILCQRFDEAAAANPSTGSSSTKGEVDLAWWLQCYAADTIAMVSYSKRIGYLDAGEDIADFTKKLHANLAYGSTVGIYAWLHPYLVGLMEWLQRMGLGQVTPIMILIRLVSTAVAGRRQERASGTKAQTSETAPKDFLDKFLDSHEVNAEKFTDRDVHMGLGANVVAGSDTTSSSLSAIFYHLLKNPDTLKKLREEVDRATASAGGSLTFKQGQAMPYLQAVIQEAMRMHPAVGLCLERVVPAGGLDVGNGHFLPAGTIVGVNAWVIHYLTGPFGPDAATFRPERWLEADAAQLAEMNRNWLPFGLGSRTCIGRHIGMLEMTKLVPELLRRFDFELGANLKQGKWEVKNNWFVIPKALPVKIRQR